MPRLRLWLTLVLVTSGLVGCGVDASPDSPTTSVGESTTPVMGVFELPDTSFAFRVIRCDFTGAAPDGLLLKGSGTMPDGTTLLPDGRMMPVEVERLTPDTDGPGWYYERATIQFGGFMEEDGWEAAATSPDGTRWTSSEMNRTLEGPIIQVSENELVVTSLFKHMSRDEISEGTLRATCPGATYP